MNWRKRRRCPHSRLRGIYGDEINAVNARLQCLDCGRYLDGPPTLANVRMSEAAEAKAWGTLITEDQ